MKFLNCGCGGRFSLRRDRHAESLDLQLAKTAASWSTAAYRGAVTSRKVVFPGI